MFAIKPILASTLMLLGASALPLTTSATTINFDDVPDGSDVTNAYRSCAAAARP